MWFSILWNGADSLWKKIISHPKIYNPEKFHVTIWELGKFLCSSAEIEITYIKKEKKNKVVVLD